MLNSIERIRKISGETEVLHRNSLAEARTEECVKMIMKIEVLTGKVLQEACETRKVLQNLNTVTHNSTSSTNSTNTKIRAVGRAFLKVMSDFDKKQEEHRKKYKLQLERQIRLIDPSGSDLNLNLDELSGSQTSLILSKQIFRLSEDSRARRELESMKARDEEMNQLEKGIQEIRILFEEITIIVREQGEMINKVEDYVIEIEGNVRKTVGILDKSITVHKLRQRRRRMGFIFGLVLLIILLGIIFNELFPDLVPFIFRKIFE